MEDKLILCYKGVANNLIGEYMGLIYMSVKPNLSAEQLIELCKQLAINRIYYILENDVVNDDAYYRNVLLELQKI